MASTNVILTIMAGITILCICYAPRVQSYKILVLNPEKQINRHIWDYKRSGTLDQNSIHNIQPNTKPTEDGSCLIGPCMAGDHAPKPKVVQSNEEANSLIIDSGKQKKFGGFKVAYDNNIPRIVYWPIFEEEL
ncbi:unnamed protein product [Spodoptera exigua]|uniref:Uncharacterized protein n=1 Tax=Spodoptera exigua TaxID=7107 RepID=A0A835G1Y0_SPOEX|nr:hypothetical protein HW555_013912 [Spodoptera exigua]CAH0697837.1 unnamed protein product [Spodoptera exigua]